MDQWFLQSNTESSRFASSRVTRLDPVPQTPSAPRFDATEPANCPNADPVRLFESARRGPAAG